MIDLPAPPFRAGDLAYGAPSPGGYASTAATPTDPQFGGNDVVYNVVPALGGDFQPGSGTPAANASLISKGSPADGGAQKIADAPRVDVPPAPTPPTPAEIDGAVNGSWLIFTGVPSADGQVTVTLTHAPDPEYNVITNIAAGDSAATVAAKVAARLIESPPPAGWNVSQTSNAIQVLGSDGRPIPGTLSIAIA